MPFIATVATIDINESVAAEERLAAAAARNARLTDSEKTRRDAQKILGEIATREKILNELRENNLPLRELLAALGKITTDGVYLEEFTVTVDGQITAEGLAKNDDALTEFTTKLEEQRDFATMLTRPLSVSDIKNADGKMRFTLTGSL